MARRPQHPPRCQLCDRHVGANATLQCCDACLDRIVQAEDAGGSWRSSYLFPNRLVEMQGEQMMRVVGKLLPRRSSSSTAESSSAAAPPPASPAAAVATLRSADCLMVMLGSGASASYDVPVNLAALSASVGPLERYAPVRHAALAASAGGSYARLRRLLAAVGHGGGSASLCVISTNIDGLASREGLP